MTLLEKQYRELMRRGLIVPTREPITDFKYPSALVPVPSFTTYGVGDTRGLNEEQIAQLERYTK